MKQETLNLKAKDGTFRIGTIVVPETLEELASLMGDRALFKCGLTYYMAKSKRRIISGSKPRRKILRLPLDELTGPQRALLVQVGLLAQE